MFDFGFSELIVIGVVLLVVVGPERLPKVARTAGHVLGRVQRYVSDVKSDIQREMQLEELKTLQAQVKQQAQELEGAVRSSAASLESQMHRTADEVRSILPDNKASDAVAPVSAASIVSGSQLLEQSVPLKAASEPGAGPSAAAEEQLRLDVASRQTPDVADKTKT